MKLSKRLEAVATLVDVGVRVIDVGCDHGYLDIYLTENNDNKCIATDINKNALESAINNIKKKSKFGFFFNIIFYMQKNQPNTDFLYQKFLFVLSLNYVGNLQIN